jgi:hypothetical protein
VRQHDVVDIGIDGKILPKARFWRISSLALVDAIVCVADTYSIVPKIVPSGRFDALRCKLGRGAETRIFTSESEHIQTPLKCCRASRISRSAWSQSFKANPSALPRCSYGRCCCQRSFRGYFDRQQLGLAASTQSPRLIQPPPVENQVGVDSMRSRYQRY